MKRNAIFSSLLLATLAFVGASLAGAQGTKPPQSKTTNGARPTGTPVEQDDTRVTVNTRIVRLPITVLDKKEQPVAGLTVNDFQVFEDKQPQKIELINETESLPIYVAVLIDTSSSTAGKLKFEQEAAKDFIYTVTRVRKDKVAFATFADDINLLQDFTEKLDLLDRAVDSIKKIGQQTSLYDAVWQMCDQKLRNVTGRRVIVLITDGEDTNSRAFLRDAIEMAQQTETIIFAISTKGGFAGSTVPGVSAGTVQDKSDRELERLCEETGGKAFFTGDILSLERSFTKVARELRSQYIVTYRPSNTNYDGTDRHIEVRIANNRDYKIRTRRGYKATKETAQ